MYNSDEAALFAKKASAGLCSHAYIIDGAEGVGKLDFALYCAKAMLCESSDKPCGDCKSCRKADGGNHPDIYVVGKDKTAAISDVRELIRRSTLKPNDSDKQIFIVCNAGKLREDSQNALLKLFEEPPATVAIFLLTESRSSLLPTVLSRGQRIHLDGRRSEEIRYDLSEKFPSVSPGELDFAVDFACGNLGTALKFLSKESVALRSRAEKLLEFALAKNSYEVASALLLQKFKREQLQALLSEFVLLIDEILKQKYGVAKTLPMQSQSLSKRLANASKKALALMAEYATTCMMNLENNANVTAAASKLSIELVAAASK